MNGNKERETNCAPQNRRGEGKELIHRSDFIGRDREHGRKIWEEKVEALV
jgi:hypothetical protein